MRDTRGSGDREVVESLSCGYELHPMYLGAVSK
jgi:hypothetical protein